MSRLVNVSNRVSMKGASSTGGLAVGILSAMRSSGGLWFGWNGETAAGEPQEVEITIREGITFATLALPQRLYDHHYNGFANGTLWPLFHYFLAGFRHEDHEYAAYREANALFARRLVEHLRPSDRIWIHDYHLIPLAERRARHERLVSILCENDIHRWHMRFLEQLTQDSPPVCAMSSPIPYSA